MSWNTQDWEHKAQKCLAVVTVTASSRKSLAHLRNQPITVSMQSKLMAEGNWTEPIPGHLNVTGSHLHPTFSFISIEFDKWTSARNSLEIWTEFSHKDPKVLNDVSWKSANQHGGRSSLLRWHAFDLEECKQWGQEDAVSRTLPTKSFCDHLWLHLIHQGLETEEQKSICSYRTTLGNNIELAFVHESMPFNFKSIQFGKTLILIHLTSMRENKRDWTFLSVCQFFLTLSYAW